jgi:hypothetical protein
MSTADAVAGLITKFFAMVEEEWRMMQRGRGPIPRLAEVWETCRDKQFYRTFTLQVAALNMPGSLSIDRLARRVAALEGPGRSHGGGTGGVGGGGGSSGSYAAAVRQGGGTKETGGPSNAEVRGTPRGLPFVPSEQLVEWQRSNPGKCFHYHLKGCCAAGGKGAKCQRGEH